MQELAARAELDEIGEEIRALGEQLEIGGARARRGHEPLELVQSLVGIGALPQRLEQHGKHGVEGAAHGLRVGHEGPALEDEAEILARPVRIGEAGGLERGVGGDARSGFPGRGRRGEELGEGLVHAMGDAAVLGLEAATRLDGGQGRAEPSREPPEGGRVFRQGVRLELVEDLQSMLDGPEEDQRLAEKASERLRQVAALGQAEDGAQAVPLAQPGIVARVEELEGLHEELDLADAAHPQLDVTALDALGAEGPVDLGLHAAHRGHDVGIHPGAEDEGADEIEEARGHAGVSRAEARLDESLPLPELRPLLEVGAVAGEREDDTAHAPFRTQAQVHPEGIALVRDRLERFHEGARPRREVVAVRDASLLAARGEAVVAVDEDEVDVGRVVELVAAELAHADDRESRGRAVLRARLSESPPQVLLRPPPRRGQADIGHARQLFRGHGEVGVTQDVAAGDAQELTVLETAQGIPPRFRPGEGARALGEARGQLVGEPLPHRARLEEPREKGGTAPQRVGEKLAGAADPRHEVKRARVTAEQPEQRGTLALGGQALEVVERHVGIGRLRHLLEETGKERRQQLGIPRIGRHRVQVGEGPARFAEAEALELGKRLTVTGRGGQEVGHVREKAAPHPALSPAGRGILLDGGLARFAGADADGLAHGQHEDLAVADGARARGRGHRGHHLVHEVVGDDQLDLHLGQEVDGVLRAPVELGVPFLPAETAHLRHRHADDAELCQRFLDVVELERLDDRFDLLHRDLRDGLGPAGRSAFL